jgi:hypothetical protein
MKQFDETDYPPAMQTLNEDLRGRAIEEANRLLDIGYTSARATSLAIARAQGKDEHRASGKATPALHVMFADHQWVIWPEDMEEPTHRFNLMEDAYRRAHQLAVERGADVYVFGPAGELIEKNEMDSAGLDGADASTIEVSPYESGWVVQRMGPERLFQRFPTKREAVAMARDRARDVNARLVIRYASGEVQERHDYTGEH